MCSCVASCCSYTACLSPALNVSWEMQLHSDSSCCSYTACLSPALNVGWEMQLHSDVIKILRFLHETVTYTHMYMYIILCFEVLSVAIIYSIKRPPPLF